MNYKKIANKFYQVLILLIVIIYNFNAGLPNTFIKLKNFTQIGYIFLFCIAFFYFLCYFLVIKKQITVRHLIVLLEIFILMIYSWIGKDILLFYVLLFSLLCNILSVDDLLKTVGLGLSITFFLFLFLAIIKFLPMYIYTGFDVTRQKSYMFTLGFAHKNGTSYYLFMTNLLIIYLNKKHMILNYIMIIVTAIFDWIIIDNRTVSLILVVLLCLLYCWDKHILSKVFYSIMTALPIILTCFSVWISKEFNGTGWIYNLSEFLSGRIAIWHYDWSRYLVSLLPQNISINNPYSMDGFYALGMLIHGVIGYAVFIVLLINLLRKSSSTQNERKIFVLCLCLILYGVTEQIPITSVSWLIPLAFLVQIKDKRSLNVINNFYTNIQSS